MTIPHATITPIPNNAPAAVPSLWNDRYTQIDENFSAVQAEISDVASDVGDLQTLIAGGPDANGLIASGKASNAALALQENKIAVEMWVPSWTLLDIQPITVVHGVSGSDLVDVDSTTELIEGQEYAIRDTSHAEHVTIQAIISPMRIQLAAPLTYSFTNASIERTSFVLLNGIATASDGGLYFGGPIDVGQSDYEKNIRIKRTENATDLLVYVKDEGSFAAWTECAKTGSYYSGTNNYEEEFLCPNIKGNAQIKVLSDGATDVEITHLIYFERFLSGLESKTESHFKDLESMAFFYATGF